MINEIPNRTAASNYIIGLMNCFTLELLSMLSRGKKSSDFQFKTVRFFIEFRFELFMFVHVSFRHDSNKLQSIFFAFTVQFFCLSLVVFLLFLYFSTVWWLTFWWYINRWFRRRYEFFSPFIWYIPISLSIVSKNVLDNQHLAIGILLNEARIERFFVWFVFRFNFY